MDSKSDLLLKNFKKDMQLKLGNILQEIILFGSKARGDDKFNSDYDCLLILDELTSKIINEIDEVTGWYLYEYIK